MNSNSTLKLRFDSSPTSPSKATAWMWGTRLVFDPQRDIPIVITGDEHQQVDADGLLQAHAAVSLEMPQASRPESWGQCQRTLMHGDRSIVAVVITINEHRTRSFFLQAPPDCERRAHALDRGHPAEIPRRSPDHLPIQGQLIARSTSRLRAHLATGAGWDLTRHATSGMFTFLLQVISLFNFTGLLWQHCDYYRPDYLFILHKERYQRPVKNWPIAPCFRILLLIVRWRRAACAAAAAAAPPSARSQRRPPPPPPSTRVNLNMPFSLTLMDSTAAAAVDDDDDDDHLLLEYDFLLPVSPLSDYPIAAGAGRDEFYRIVSDEADSHGSMTFDDDDALALELELGLDQYDALEHLLRAEADERSCGEEPVDTASSGADFHEVTVVDELMETEMTGGGTGDMMAAAHHVESAITRHRRPRNAVAPVQSNGDGTKKQLKYNSNKARDERREELLYLRRKVTELETSLGELRQGTQQPQLASNADGDGGRRTTIKQQRARRRTRVDREASTRAVVATMSVWQEIASRQYEHRMKAERENIRLKIVLESQLKLAKSLEKLLKKTSSTKEFEKCTNTKQQRVSFTSPSPMSHTSDAELFEKLLAGVEQSYKEVDAVFEATGLARMDSSRIDARVQQAKQDSLDEAGSLCHHQIELQVFGSKVMPFDMHATGLAVWNHYVFAKERIPNRSYCHNSPQTMVSTTADTIMENFNVQVDVNATSVLFCLKLVLRRYVEEERIVVVWRAFFDPTQISNEPLLGVRFLEKGYVVVKKQQPNSTVGFDETTMGHNLLQTCFISTPVSIGDLVHADPSKVGALTDLVLSATAANIASSHQMIENVLIEQAMKNNGGQAAMQAI